jgi:hypothetical protein
MSTRTGGASKQGQKHQNTYAFKHNKNSILTRKIKQSPLDHLCERCMNQVEWRINFRKYKPLSAPSKCNLCDMKNVYKAYRSICDVCANAKKICTKCTEPIEDYAK